MIPRATFNRILVALAIAYGLSVAFLDLPNGLLVAWPLALGLLWGFGHTFGLTDEGDGERAERRAERRARRR